MSGSDFDIDKSENLFPIKTINERLNELIASREQYLADYATEFDYARWFIARLEAKRKIGNELKLEPIDLSMTVTPDIDPKFVPWIDWEKYKLEEDTTNKRIGEINSDFLIIKQHETQTTIREDTSSENEDVKKSNEGKV